MIERCSHKHLKDPRIDFTVAIVLNVVVSHFRVKWQAHSMLSNLLSNWSGLVVPTISVFVIAELRD